MSDQPARDLAISDFDNTLLIEAGAGTGKTTLLVSRICALIERDVKVERIAAVTFTVKAAGELKQRLRDKLKLLSSEQAKQALLNLDRMTVNTIHGFAAEMLRTLPVEANLPPEFTALDDLQYIAVAEEFKTNWLTRALEGAVPDAFDWVEDIGLDLLGSETKGFVKLFDVLNRSNVDIDKISAGEVPLQTVEEYKTSLINKVSELIICAQQCKKHDDKLYEAIQNLAVWTKNCPQRLYSREGINWLRRKDFGSKGNATKWSSAEALESARSAREALVDTVAQAKLAITSRICTEGVLWISPAIQEFRQQLRERGTIGFDDLLLLCRNMLRDSMVARDYFKSRFDYLHIDEFQDTDPLQVEILFYLAESTNEFTKNWRNITLKPGKLFVVGDPKQSIYRFRGADVRIYNDVAKQIEATGKKISITRNFRSRPSILNEVNAIFAPVMTGQSEHEAQYESLHHGATAEHDPSAIELLLPPEGYDRTIQSADQSAVHEAAALAEHLQKLVNGSKSPIFSDVAILLRTGTRVTELTNALSARKIPFISFMNSAFTSRVEIEAVLTMLHAIANPQHTVATIGVLRSPWFSISDDELFEHKLSGRSFVYSDAHSAINNLDHALGELREWHRRSKQISTSALLEELLAHYPIEIIYGVKSEGVQRVQNLHTLVALVRRLELSGVGSVGEVVARISDMKRLVLSTELEARDEKRDAVQILTLHKAKGLEFNVVYLYAFRDKIKASGEWLLNKSLSDQPHQLALCINRKEGFCTSNWNYVSEQNTIAEKAELQRLLYVGMTRAKDKLILPLGWSRKGTSSPIPDIPSALLARYPLTAELALDPTGTEVVICNGADTVETEFRPFSAQFELGERHNQAIEDKFAAWKTANEIRVSTLCPQVEIEANELDEIDWSRVRARKIGSFVHLVLEQMVKQKSLADAERFASRSTSLSKDEFIESQEIIEKVLKSKLFTVELPSARRIITELPIFEAQSDRINAKFVDLMFETEQSEWILVDYKTDDILISETNTAKEQHRAQLESYAQMFARITGQPPAELRLYFVRPNVMVNL